MSFRNTKTPNKPTTAAKWQVPMRPQQLNRKNEQDEMQEVHEPQLRLPYRQVRTRPATFLWLARPRKG